MEGVAGGSTAMRPIGGAVEGAQESASRPSNGFDNPEADGWEIDEGWQWGLEVAMMEGEPMMVDDGWVEGECDNLKAAENDTRKGDTSDTDKENFLAANNFQGARPSYLYKLGPKGLGYYLDGGWESNGSTATGNSKERGEMAEGEANMVVKLSIAQALGLEEKSEEFKLIERISKRKNELEGGIKREKDKERSSEREDGRRRRPRGKRDPRDFTPRGDHAGEDEFRNYGLWAVDQVNPNGGNAALGYLEVSVADMVYV